MSEENSWVDFSSASPWEESISRLEEIFVNFQIGFRLPCTSHSLVFTSLASDNEIDTVKEVYMFDGLQYCVKYSFSSFSNVLSDGR